MAVAGIADYAATLRALSGSYIMKEGQSIGPYRVLRKLGEGGMGVVFESIHQDIERHVAIKILHPEYAKNAEFSTRFVNEARAVNRVDHPGLVQISDYGRLDDGSAYIVMEYIKGETLRTRLTRSRGRLPIADAVRLCMQLADTLTAAHAEGIVHRDLKPDNVMITRSARRGENEQTKLLDFGIAKLFEENSYHIKTKTSAVMGTPIYMSPEQCRGAGGVEPKSDVYSLGVMMYQMLSGQPPFCGEGVGEILGKHIYEEPPPLASIVPSAPVPLIELIHDMLRKDKKQRPDMSQVTAALELIAAQFLSKETHAAAQRLAAPSVQSLAATLPRPATSSARLERISTLGLSAGQTLLSPSRRIVTILGSGAITLCLIVLCGRAFLVHRTRVPSAVPIATRNVDEESHAGSSAVQLKSQIASSHPALAADADRRALVPLAAAGSAERVPQPQPALADPPGGPVTESARAGKADKKTNRARDAAALVEQGRIQLNDGAVEASLASFKLAVDFEPRNADAIGGLGRASFEQGNYKAALNYLAIAIKLAPRRSTTYQELRAQVLYKMGRLSDAAEACHKLLAQAPESVLARQILALAESQLPITAPAKQPPARIAATEILSKDLRRPPNFGVPSQPPPVSAAEPSSSLASAAIPRPHTTNGPSSQELYNRGRYKDAVDSGLREARGGSLDAWRIVGLAACKTPNPTAASEAYRVASAEIRRQIAFACADSGFKLINGAFRSLY